MVKMFLDFINELAPEFFEIEEIKTKRKKTSVYTFEELKNVNYSAYKRVLKEYQKQIQKYKYFSYREVDYTNCKNIDLNNIENIESIIKEHNKKFNMTEIFTKNGIKITFILKELKNFKNFKGYNYNTFDLEYYFIRERLKNTIRELQKKYTLNNLTFKTNKLLKEHFNKELNNRARLLETLQYSEVFTFAQMYVNVTKAEIINNNLILVIEVSGLTLTHFKTYNISIQINK